MTITIYLSFNPCFNGCFSSTSKTEEEEAKYKEVSILVLMDVSLQLCHRLSSSYILNVSILVLMDVSLQRRLPMTIKAKVLSFNPCFNGCFSSTRAV